MSRPEIFSIIAAPEHLCFVQVDMDGKPRAMPVRIIGYENVQTDDHSFPFNGHSKAPKVRAWFSPSPDGLLFQTRFEHSNKSTGACKCGESTCEQVGIAFSPQFAIRSDFMKMVTERAGWLKRQAKVAREQNPRLHEKHKEKKVKATG